MMTLLLRPEFSPQYASMLTLVMGMAVAQATEELGFNVSIKWPNDIVISKKKICGILTEMGTNGVKINYVLIGVGINVNLKEFPEEEYEVSLYVLSFISSNIFRCIDGFAQYEKLL